MAAQPKATIKGYFQTGDKPTEAQFAELIDSYKDFPTLESKTTSFTISKTLSLCDSSGDSNFTATLPGSTAVAGDEYIINKTDGSINPIKLIDEAAKTISGFAYILINEKNDSVKVMYNGTNWNIVE